MFEDVEEGYLDGEKESKFHYFYNREERIANAPQNVKDYYDGNMKSKRAQEKMGFRYHHTCDEVPVTLLNEVRVGHTNYMTLEMWKNRI